MSGPLEDPQEAPEHPGEGWEVAWSSPGGYADAAGPAGLFGATVTPGLFDPTPTVTVNGQPVAAGPAGAADSLIVVDGVSVTWGRTEIMDQPTPATGRLRIFDATKTWATSQDRRGQAVILGWSGTKPDGTAVTDKFLRGRIGSPITVSRRTVLHPVTGETIHGSLVELPLRDLLVDLANTVPTVDWPAETMGARFDRLCYAAQAVGVATGGGVFRTYWRDPPCPAIKAADQPSLLDSFHDLLNSAGADRFRYFPSDDHVDYMPRRDYPGTRGMAGLWWDATDPTLARHGQGVYLRTYSMAPAGGIAPPALYLDSAALEYDPADGITQPELITRVSMSHPDSANAYATVTTEERVTDDVTGALVNETVAGIRSVRVDSLCSWNSYADQARGDWATMARREGARWQLEPLRLRTRKVGGFETYEQAAGLVVGVERTHLYFLQRSWLPEYGIRPIFGVMGGTIAYEDGGWDLELVLAPITTTLPQHAISWSEIDDGSATYEVQWWDGDHPHGMHESLTYEDLAYCATGLNVTTIPADTGWDALQT